MARHKVTFEVPARPLAHADIEFVVNDENGKYGTLLVSKGGIVWKSRLKRKGHRLTWTKLDELSKEGQRER